jgi:hypothetical protein
MKNQLKQKVNSIKRYAAFLCLLAVGNLLQAQENIEPKTAPKKEPIKKTFAGNLIIDNQSVMVPVKGVFEFVIQHRFGIVSNGYKDFYGIYAPSNIRLGFNYTPIKDLQVGFGLTKERMQWDGNIKYALIKQSKKGGNPLSATYYGSFAVDTRNKKGNFVNNSDRISYFHQLIIARKITKSLSLQVAPSLSWYNNVEGYISSDGTIKSKMNNAHFAFAVSGSYALSDKFDLIVNYDQPLTQHTTNNPRPNISLGLQIATATHGFQVFLGNYQSIVPQTNNFYNQYDYKEGQFLIGFNITKR